MKKLIALICVLTMVWGCSSALAYTAGEYDGTGMGIGGELKVHASFSESEILAIEVIANNETVGIGDKAIAQLPQQIVEHQSLGVDGIAGATITSKAILEAVAQCVELAGGDVQALKSVVVEKKASGEVKEIKTDIVVIGGGLGGLSAAITAKEAGADVILLEKMSFVGGNSALSSGGIFLGGTNYQKNAGIEDTPEAYYDFVMEKSGGKRDVNQVKMLSAEGSEAIDWMIQQGVVFAEKLNPTPGCPVNRIHLSQPSARGMIAALEASAIEKGVQLWLSTPAVALIENEAGAVTGVTATNEAGDTLKITADKTIIAAGGFGNSKEMIKEYWGMEVLYAGAMGNTGDMIRSAIELGADTLDMEGLNLTPTVEYDTVSLISGACMTKGGAFLVDSTGKRFCDETRAYLDTANAIFSRNEEYVFEIMDSHILELIPKVPGYIDQGIVIQADTIEGLAQEIGVDVQAFSETVAAYNQAVKGEIEDEFGRKGFAEPCDMGPFYAIKVRPGTSFTVGGLKINENCQVLHVNGGTIENLYAVGESTGGYRAHNYIGGESLANALVTGRVAAKHAVK